MASTLSTALTRITEMQIEALTAFQAALTPPGNELVAKPFWPYEQAAFPYMFNRISGDTVVRDDVEGFGASEDIVLDLYTVAMRLVVNHITAGYEGEIQSDIYEYIPLLKDFFDLNQLLTSTNSPEPLDFIAPNGVAITGGTGLSVFPNSGVGAAQLGYELTLELPIIREITGG
jgi:hypothetical protein